MAFNYNNQAYRYIKFVFGYVNMRPNTKLKMNN